MRLIGTLENEQRAAQFSRFLQQKGIVHQIDVSPPNTDWGDPNYGLTSYRIWIYEEDQTDEAINWYQQFIDHPDDSAFHLHYPQGSSYKEQSPPPPTPPPSSKATLTDEQDSLGGPSLSIWEQQPMGIVTRLLLIGCCILFFVSKLLTPFADTPNSSIPTLFSSPTEKLILYDYPAFYELLEKLIKTYGSEGLEQPKDLPPEGRSLLQQINQTPYWEGVYSLIQKHGFDIANWTYAPMFEKIRQGQIWRLFSPALFHGDLFHLFFNMIWLIVLGKQIEQRIKPLRYIFFILMIGILSNTGQYLMGGPNFVGFSGVLCGMLTFIWVRQREAPWEGYQLDRLTILFMLLFIGSMAFLQIVYFFIETTAQIRFSVGIANTAHLTGALVGVILAKLNFFSWRHT